MTAATKRIGSTVPWQPIGTTVTRLAVVMLLAMAPVNVLAHGGGLELTVTPADIAAGEQITVSGEGFTPETVVDLHLTGPNGDSHLGSVRTDEEGEFTESVTIPGDVIPGHYLVRTQGDREASAELSVGAMAGMTAPTSATTVERGRSSAWDVGALLILVAIAGLGVVILRPRRHAVSEHAT